MTLFHDRQVPLHPMSEDWKESKVPLHQMPTSDTKNIYACCKCEDGVCHEISTKLDASEDRVLDRTQRESLNNVCAEARSLIHAGIAVAKASKSSSIWKSLVSLWFTEEADIDVLVRHLTTLDDMIARKLFVESHGLDGDVPDYSKTFAFTYLGIYPNAANIYVCQKFWATSSAAVRNSRPGILVHELCHCAFSAKDHKYGPSECSKLEWSMSQNNADSYEFFCEDAIQKMRQMPTTPSLRQPAPCMEGSWSELTVLLEGGRRGLGPGHFVQDRYEISQHGSGQLVLCSRIDEDLVTRGSIVSEGIHYQSGANEFRVHMLSADIAFGTFAWRSDQSSGFVVLERMNATSVEEPAGKLLVK